jgi:hypothetical protein
MQLARLSLKPQLVPQHQAHSLRRQLPRLRRFLTQLVPQHQAHSLRRQLPRLRRFLMQLVPQHQVHSLRRQLPLRRILMELVLSHKGELFPQRQAHSSSQVHLLFSHRLYLVTVAVELLETAFAETRLNVVPHTATVVSDLNSVQ